MLYLPFPFSSSWVLSHSLAWARVKNPPKTFAFDLYVLYHATRQKFRIDAISVLFPPRIHGTSKWAATFFGRYKTILGMIAYMRVLSKTEGRI